MSGLKEILGFIIFMAGLRAFTNWWKSSKSKDSKPLSQEERENLSPVQKLLHHVVHPPATIEVPSSKTYQIVRGLLCLMMLQELWTVYSWYGGNPNDLFGMLNRHAENVAKTAVGYDAPNFLLRNRIREYEAFMQEQYTEQVDAGNQDAVSYFKPVNNLYLPGISAEFGSENAQEVSYAEFWKTLYEKLKITENRQV